MDVIAWLVFSGVLAAVVSRMHARSQHTLIETNPHVLEHRLAIRLLDDAREQREQHLLGDGSEQ